MSLTTDVSGLSSRCFLGVPPRPPYSLRSWLAAGWVVRSWSAARVCEVCSDETGVWGEPLERPMLYVPFHDVIRNPVVPAALTGVVAASSDVESDAVSGISASDIGSGVAPSTV